MRGCFRDNGVTAGTQRKHPPSIETLAALVCCLRIGGRDLHHRPMQYLGVCHDVAVIKTLRCSR